MNGSEAVNGLMGHTGKKKTKRKETKSKVMDLRRPPPSPSPGHFQEVFHLQIQQGQCQQGS